MACSTSQMDTQNANASATSVSTTSSSAAIARPPRFTMEGVGARVIRGPDWKWGKQVTDIFQSTFPNFTLEYFTKDNKLNQMFCNIPFL